MNYEKKKILIELAIALFVAVSLFAVGFSIGVKTKHYEPTIVCDTIRTTDTVRLPAPPPDTVTKTVTKVKKVPLYITTTDTVVDSVLVRLPFEQHYAMLEDVADVWYSGYEAKIDSAVVFDPTTLNTTAISFGTNAVLHNNITGKDENVTILGAWESDPDAGIISYKSPLGNKLLDAKVGQTLKFEINRQEYDYTVKLISAAQF